MGAPCNISKPKDNTFWEKSRVYPHGGAEGGYQHFFRVAIVLNIEGTMQKFRTLGQPLYVRKIESPPKKYIIVGGERGVSEFC